MSAPWHRSPTGVLIVSGEGSKKPAHLRGPYMLRSAVFALLVTVPLSGGIAAETGTVTVIDLAAGKAVASIEISPQAGGIDVWK